MRSTVKRSTVLLVVMTLWIAPSASGISYGPALQNWTVKILGMPYGIIEFETGDSFFYLGPVRIHARCEALELAVRTVPVLCLLAFCSVSLCRRWSRMTVEGLIKLRGSHHSDKALRDAILSGYSGSQKRDDGPLTNCCASSCVPAVRAPNTGDHNVTQPKETGR